MIEITSTAPLRAFADLLELRSGQRISASRAWRIESALRPLMRELHIADLDVLAAEMRYDDALATRVVELLLNNETSFFRDAKQFELFDKGPLSAFANQCSRDRHLRLWSAGCSTGQEAYSLAMLLREAGPRWAGWKLDIVATDISAAAIGRGREGRYAQFEIQRGLPVRSMLQWFRQDGSDWIVDPSLKAMVNFRVQNLLDQPAGQFDAILCRNLLMYLQPEARRRVFDHLACALAPGGVLMLGAGEMAIGQTKHFVPHAEWRGFYASIKDVSASKPLCRTG